MPQSIRPADGHDLDLLVELDRRIFHAAAYSAEQWLNEMGSPSGLIFISAAENATAVGFASALVAGDDLEIRKIGVVPEYRRQGLAQKLIQRCIATAVGNKSEQRCLIDVSVENFAALAFYQSQGFTEIMRRKKYYADGSEAIVMVHSFPRSP